MFDFLYSIILVISVSCGGLTFFTKCCPKVTVMYASWITHCGFSCISDALGTSNLLYL